MALSLAACGGSDDVAAPVTPVTPVTPVVLGVTSALTAEADPVVTGAGNDTVTAAAGTLNSGDIIADSVATDADVLNVTLSTADIAANPTAAISGYEAINVDIDAFDGTATTLDADNISGATITLSSARLGFNGEAGVENIGDNNVTAGAGIDDLTVAGLEAGIVDTGAADVASVTTAAATDAANVTVNGDIDLTVATSTEVNITAAAGAAIDLTAVAAEDIIISGSDVEVTISAADVTANNLTGASSVVVNTADADVDLTGVTGSITLDDDFDGDTVTTADDASIILGEDQGTVTFVGDADNAANALAISTAFDITELDVSDDGLTTTITVTDDVTIATLTATGEAVVLTGATDVTLTTSDAASIDATALTGDFTMTSTVAATVLGGEGSNDVTTAQADTTFVGQDGGDTLNSASTTTTLAATFGAGDDTLELDVTTGTIVADLGAGDNTVDFVAANVAAGAEITLSAGTGSDTLNFTLDDDLDAADTLALTGFDAMTLEAGVDISIAAADITGDTYAISGTTGGTETFEIVALATGSTVDASNLTVATTINTFTITGGAAADTITGTATDDVIVGAAGDDVIVGGAGDDTITAGTGADTVTGGSGIDTFIFATDDSTEASMTTITDFTVSQFDVLSIDSVVEADGGTDDELAMGAGANIVAGDEVALGGAAAAADDIADGDIFAVVTDGILTLSGEDADVEAIDTLAEWLDAAGLALASYEAEVGTDDGDIDEYVIAFEFSGDTYVVSAIDGNAADDIAVNDVIMLEGVTDVAAVDLTAAADTIVIA